MSTVVTAPFSALPGRLARAVAASLAVLLVLGLLGTGVVSPATGPGSAPSLGELAPGTESDPALLRGDGATFDADDLGGDARTGSAVRIAMPRAAAPRSRADDGVRKSGEGSALPERPPRA